MRRFSSLLAFCCSFGPLASGQQTFLLEVQGVNTWDEFGFAVDGAGDVNADGVNDFTAKASEY